MTALWFIIGITGSIILTLMAKQIQRHIKDSNAKKKKLEEAHKLAKAEFEQQKKAVMSRWLPVIKEVSAEQQAIYDIKKLIPKLRELEKLVPELDRINPPPFRTQQDTRGWIIHQIQLRHRMLIEKQKLQEEAKKNSTKSRFELLEID